MEKQKSNSSYYYDDADLGHAHEYLLPELKKILEDVGSREVFDLGCGNGAVAARLENAGYSLTGVDPSEEGIQQAREHHPDLDVYVRSAYDNLEDEFGRFPVVISLEVVEHVYSPKEYADTLFSLLTSGGRVIVSTPYHGYLKNLLIALQGGWGTTHYNPLWEGGHIKIWSQETLTELLEEAGFREVDVRRVGRAFSSIAKSMVIVATKPE
jgi:2-polyprenyl-6-hydroxyphenyl methylase/3-demethylubiquinone-9 3-methyltransferase